MSLRPVGSDHCSVRPPDLSQPEALHLILQPLIWEPSRQPPTRRSTFNVRCIMKDTNFPRESKLFYFHAKQVKSVCGVADEVTALFNMSLREIKPLATGRLLSKLILSHYKLCFFLCCQLCHIAASNCLYWHHVSQTA